jgi:DNA-binding transcriptional regulator YdaS (Cro superfamily)
MVDRSPALMRAITKAGGVSALARALGLTKQAVSRWTQAPMRHLAYLAQYETRAKLRPDIYGRREKE